MTAVFFLPEGGVNANRLEGNFARTPMRFLLVALLIATITTRVHAHIGESLDHVKARIDASSIVGEAKLPHDTICLLWKRSEGIYSNVKFSTFGVLMEQFSKYDGTDLSEAEVEMLLHEEVSPDRWEPAPYSNGKMFVNKETGDSATYVTIPVGSDHHAAHFLNVFRGRQHPPSEDNKD